MKKTFRWMMGVAALAGAVVVTSCSDDDDDDPTPDSDFVVVRDDLKGQINNGEVVLESGTYKLTGALVVKEGAKLTIKQGVVIEGTKTTTASQDVRFIGVSRGAKIDIQGTATSPVVFTAEEKKPGAWGGLVICGAAPTNQGPTAESEVGGLSYGGTNQDDNSGSVKYLRVEYSGYSYSSTKEFNGLSLFGVGKGTTIEYVQVHEGSDDGFEWFGGTVNAKYLVVTNSIAGQVGDDLFDWTEGWNGTGEYWYGKRTNAGNRGIEADNLENNHNNTPISSPTIKHLTLIGSGSTGDQSVIGEEPQAIKLRRGTQGIFENVVLSNWKTGIDIEHDETLAFVGNKLKLTGVKFDKLGANASGKKTDGTAADVSAAFTEDPNATGAGKGTDKPDWANGWTVGL